MRRLERGPVKFPRRRVDLTKRGTKRFDFGAPSSRHHHELVGVLRQLPLLIAPSWLRAVLLLDAHARIEEFRW